ncbi:MAG: hypothetical protein BM555_03015, partial [Crocinitomix sp. MedPE-SWsnd]
GANYDLQAAMNYKDQWRNVNSPFRTFAVSYDMRMMAKESKGGFLAGGINFVNDRAGSSKMGFTMADISLAYHIRLNHKNTLGLGVKSGVLQRGADLNNVSWGTQFDGQSYNSALASGEVAQMNNFTKFDMGAGMAWTYDNTNGGRNLAGSSPLRINVGFSAFHLTSPDFSFLGSDEKLHMKYVGHANALIGISDSRWAILPGMMYYRQGTAQEIYAGALTKVTLSRSTQYNERAEGAAIAFGAYYRANDAVSTHLLIDYAAFTFGLSYDINVSDLKVGSNGRGGLELSISYVTNFYKEKIKGGARH